MKWQKQAANGRDALTMLQTQIIWIYDGGRNCLAAKLELEARGFDK